MVDSTTHADSGSGATLNAVPTVTTLDATPLTVCVSVMPDGMVQVSVSPMATVGALSSVTTVVVADEMRPP